MNLLYGKNLKGAIKNFWGNISKIGFVDSLEFPIYKLFLAHKICLQNFPGNRQTGKKLFIVLILLFYSLNRIINKFEENFSQPLLWIINMHMSDQIMLYSWKILTKCMKSITIFTANKCLKFNKIQLQLWLGKINAKGCSVGNLIQSKINDYS